MPKVKEQTRSAVSRSLLPKTETAGLSTEQLKRLYYRTTTSTSFVPKSLQSNASFSDVHKAAQHMGKFKPSLAPFWSRDMSRYRQAYIALPLDGAVINRELAETFRPDGSSSIGRSGSLPLCGKTRYVEDFCTLNSNGVDCRGVNCRPNQRKHVREDDHLIFTDSVSHEKFSDLSHLSKRRTSCRPGTFRGVHLRFNGASRYSEEFVNVSKSAYRIAPIRVSDDSNRVQGNSIPNKLRDYMYNADMPNVSELDSIETVMMQREVPAKKNVDEQNPDHNPYLDEYLSYHRRAF